MIYSHVPQKPVVIEAIQYWGDNLSEVLDFTGKHNRFDEWFSSFDEFAAHVAKGVKGEFYPCRPDIFAATYEAAE